MNTKSTSVEWLIVAPCLLALAYVGLIWHQLPSTIASHFTLDGRADDWMPKEKLVLTLGSAALAIYLLLRFLSRIDPKGQLQSTLFPRIRFIVSLLMAIMLASVFYVAVHPGDKGAGQGATLAMVSLGIAALGNYITTVKPNWFIGIRTPWTLTSDRVWTRTHRLGGRLMMAGGLLAALLALLVPAPYTVGVVVAVMLAVSLIPVVYSYVYFRQEKAHSHG